MSWTITRSPPVAESLTRPRRAARPSVILTKEGPVPKRRSSSEPPSGPRSPAPQRSPLRHPDEGMTCLEPALLQRSPFGTRVRAVHIIRVWIVELCLLQGSQRPAHPSSYWTRRSYSTNIRVLPDRHSTDSTSHPPCPGSHRPAAVLSSNGSRKGLTMASASSRVRADVSSDLLPSAA